jgi:hypothetical protein
MIIKNVIISSYSFSLKNISHFKCKFLTIRMLEEDLEHQIINLQQGLNHLFVQCRWDWIKVLKWNNLGWNQIQFNLSDFTRRAYGSNYIETLRVTIHANCRIRRIYFSDRLYSEEELPPEFKLFLPIQKQQWEKLLKMLIFLLIYFLMKYIFFKFLF